MSPRASAFRVRLVTPERVALDEEAVSAVVPVHDGSLGILPNHAALVAPVATGILSLRFASGETREWAIREGFLEVRDNVVRVVADTGERDDEVDLERAKEAEARARARIAESLRGSVELEGARRALLRSLVRQRLVERRSRRGTR